MRFSRSLPCLLLGLSAWMWPSNEAHAATIIYSGSANGTEITDWRTVSTTKTMDLDANGVYGSMGALSANGEMSGAQNSGDSSLGWALIGYGTALQDSTYQMIDSVNGAPGDSRAAIVQDYLTFQLTGSTTDFLGKTVRVGIMTDVLGPLDRSADRAKGFQIMQTFGGSGNSGVISIRNAGAADGNQDMYFFDLTGVNPGDQFQILALNNVGGGSFNAGYLAAVSWDIIPEPSAGLLLLLGAASWLAGRRRMAK